MPDCPPTKVIVEVGLFALNRRCSPLKEGSCKWSRLLLLITALSGGSLSLLEDIA